MDTAARAGAGTAQAMVDADLVFDALVKPMHLPHIETLAGRFPDLLILIDHAGKPDIAADHWQPWADGMARLTSHTSAFCKLSGLMTEAGLTPAPGAVQPWARHVLACFGADRLLWGSDWPVLELAGSYAQWRAETQQLLAHLSPRAQNAVMDGNARRLYRLSQQ